MMSKSAVYWLGCAMALFGVAAFAARLYWMIVQDRGGLPMAVLGLALSIYAATRFFIRAVNSSGTED